MANMTFSPNIALVLLRGESLAWHNYLHSPTASCPLLSRAYNDSFFCPNPPLVMLPELVAWEKPHKIAQLGICTPSSQLLKAIGKHFVHHWVSSPQDRNLLKTIAMNL